MLLRLQNRVVYIWASLYLYWNPYLQFLSFSNLFLRIISCCCLWLEKAKSHFLLTYKSISIDNFFLFSWSRWAKDLIYSSILKKFIFRNLEDGIKKDQNSIRDDFTNFCVPHFRHIDILWRWRRAKNPFVAGVFSIKFVFIISSEKRKILSFSCFVSFVESKAYVTNDDKRYGKSFWLKI